MTRLTLGTATVALLAGIGIAHAQQPPAGDAQQPPAAAQQSPISEKRPPARQLPDGETKSTAPPVTEGRSAPGDSQLQKEDARHDRAMETRSGQGGKEEPSSYAPTEKPMSTAVFVHGKLAVPGAAPDGPTVPAKFSERNAALDKAPTMARPLPLTEEEKKRIYASVAQTAPAQASDAVQPAHVLPNDVALHELPKNITQEIPAVSELHYAKFENKVLLVRAPNRIVVGVIEK
jgi:hypothetical protein